MKQYTTMNLQIDVPPEREPSSWRTPTDGLRDMDQTEEAAMSLLRLVVAVALAVSLVATTLSVMV